MKKIPTIFERDWDGDRSRVLDVVTPGCEWVFAGEGTATRKYDGTCCLVRAGLLYKRLSLKPGDPEPPGIFVGRDAETAKTILWVEVGGGPEDQWHREAWKNAHSLPDRPDVNVGLLQDGTYELVGPKVQGNVERIEQHCLIAHIDAEILSPQRDYDGLVRFLRDRDIEGIVFHHPDGRMGKIKGRDLGLRRKPTPAVGRS